MGKRRDKTGRRQILQLNDDKPPPVTMIKSPLPSLMQYSDSDEEESKTLNNESTLPIDDKKESSNKIDIEVADFLKEIDALHKVEDDATETSEVDIKSPVINLLVLKENSIDYASTNLLENYPVENEYMKKEIDSHEKFRQNSNVHEDVRNSEYYNNDDDDDSSNNGSYSTWQHCYDENTGYTYFWNMETNEVTWECPPEYDNYLQSTNISTSSIKTNNLPNKMLKKHSNNNKRKLEVELQNRSNEGKIIPITYFEPSTSSEDSSEEEKIKKKEKYKRKSAKIHQEAVLYHKDNKVIKEIGPKNCLSIKSSLRKPSTQYNELIGPQLPSYYLPRELKIKDKNETLMPNSYPSEININTSVQCLKSQDLTTSVSHVRNPFLNEKFDNINNLEPDSTTKKEFTIENKNKIEDDRIKSMSENCLKTLVQYAESGSEEELDNCIENTNYCIENYRRDGREGFGFKETNNWLKSNIDKEKDYPMINFIKSNEVLDLKKLNEQNTNEIKIKDNFLNEVNIEHTSENFEIPMNLRSSSETLQTLFKNRKEEEISNSLKIEGSEEPLNISENMQDIQDTSNILIDKLSFLTVGQIESSSSLCQLFFQLQTRFTDWKEKALSSSYFLMKLKEVQDFLRQYEMNAMPTGWICNWNRQHKRYFYVNERTGHTQWEYPQVTIVHTPIESLSECTVPSSCNITDQEFDMQISLNPAVSSSASETQSSQMLTMTSVCKSNTVNEESWMKISTNNISESPPPSPPGVDKPSLPPTPPPPPPPPPSNSPPPLPPDSTDLEDGEIADVEMEIDSDNQADELSMSTSSLPLTCDVKFAKISYPVCSSITSSSSPLSFVTANTTTSNSIFITKPPHNSTISHSNEDKILPCNAVTCSSQSDTLIYQSTSKFLSNNSPNIAVEFNSAETSSSSTPLVSVSAPLKKKKCKLSSGLTLKKKNIPSLVQKWQKIKEEQDKDSENPCRKSFT